MNMLERVARALWDAWILAWPQPTDEHGNLIDQSWESLGESGQRIFSNLAWRAIAAMREPTDAMFEAAMNSGSVPLCRGEIEHLWETMVNEALKEKIQ